LSEEKEVAFSIMIGGVTFPIAAKSKVFKTGSRGINFSGRIHHDLKEYIVSGNLIEVGSKPKAVGLDLGKIGKKATP
jgi:hypothetical protein